MDEKPSVAELVSRWHRLQQAGRALSAEELCADCPDRLEALKEHLQAVAAMDTFLQFNTPSVARAAAVTMRPAAPTVAGLNGTVPGYEILGELGRGGMGVVYKARQAGLNRVVALKMILTGAHAAELDVARFRTEAEVLARLQHPNIIAIYEIGEHDGRPFFSLEYAEGGSLAQHMAGKPLPSRQAAELAETLARAVQAAHERGIIHRDLKPLNVLLTSSEALKITDFGLAKQLDRQQGQTQTGAVLGTPNYMAPEQARGDGRAVGPSADVYALGAILYDMLTGRPPFQGATVIETLEHVLHQDPVAPTQLQPGVPRDLETICLKCLHKEPAKRYASAADLAADLRRFLDGRPVHARPVGRLERGGRWCRRNPVVAGLVALVAVVLLAGAGVASYFAVKADRRAREAEEQALWADQKSQEAAQAETKAHDKAEELGRFLYYQRVALAYHELSEGHVGRADQLLEECRQHQPQLLGWEWRLLKRLRGGPARTLAGHREGIWDMAFSSDGRLLASSGADQYVRVWDARTGEQVHALRHQGPVIAVAICPDGSQLATGSVDLKSLDQGLLWKSLTGDADSREAIKAKAGYEVQVWDVKTGRPAYTLAKHPSIITSLSYSPDGSRLVSTNWASQKAKCEIKVWDLAARREALRLPLTDDVAFTVVFSPDGHRLASGCIDGTVKVWDAADGKLLRTLRGHAGPVMRIAYPRDGRYVASASMDGTVRIWDVDAGRERFTLRGHTGFVSGLAFSPDGRRLASASLDNKVVKVWDAGSGQEALTLQRRVGAGEDLSHTDTITNLAFSFDGQQLATADVTGKIFLWDATPPATESGAEDLVLEGHTDSVASVAFSPDGTQLASASWDKTVRVWDATTGRPLHILEGHDACVASVAFSPDGRRLASGSWDKTAKLWDRQTGALLHTLRGHDNLVYCVAFSPDGARLASAGGEGTVKVWDVAPARERTTLSVSGLYPTWGLAFSPDGRWLATVDGAKAVKVWDAATGERARRPAMETGRNPGGVAFSADGKKLAAASWDATVKVWDATTGRELVTFRGHRGKVNAVAFSPAGGLAASAGDDGSVCVWDATTGKEVVPATKHVGFVWGVAFSPDGRRLASASGYSGKGQVRIWPLPPATRPSAGVRDKG